MSRAPRPAVKVPVPVPKVGVKVPVPIPKTAVKVPTPIPKAGSKIPVPIPKAGSRAPIALSSAQRSSGSIGRFAGTQIAVADTSVRGRRLVVGESTVSTNPVEDVLMETVDLWGGSADEAKSLVTLTYPSGLPVMDQSDKTIIVEVIGMLMNDGYKKTYDYLSRVANRTDAVWDQPSMEDAKDDQNREIQFSLKEEVGTKELGSCGFCKSEILIYVLIQTRSGDEPQTLFVKCPQCNKSWKH